MQFENSIDIHIGNKLKKKRTELGWSQKKLGETINVTFQQIQKYERGVNRISSSKLYEITQALNVNINYFFDELDDYYEEDKLDFTNKIIDELLNKINKLEMVINSNKPVLIMVN